MKKLTHRQIAIDLVRNNPDARGAVLIPMLMSHGMTRYAAKAALAWARLKTGIKPKTKSSIATELFLANSALPRQELIQLIQKSAGMTFLGARVFADKLRSQPSERIHRRESLLPIDINPQRITLPAAVPKMLLSLDDFIDTLNEVRP